MCTWRLEGLSKIICDFLGCLDEERSLGLGCVRKGLFRNPGGGLGFSQGDAIIVTGFVLMRFMEVTRILNDRFSFLW